MRYDRSYGWSAGGPGSWSGGTGLNYDWDYEGTRAGANRYTGETGFRARPPRDFYGGRYGADSYGRLRYRDRGSRFGEELAGRDRFYGTGYGGDSYNEQTGFYGGQSDLTRGYSSDRYDYSMGAGGRGGFGGPLGGGMGSMRRGAGGTPGGPRGSYAGQTWGGFGGGSR